MPAKKKTLPQDTLLIEKCIKFCSDVDALVTESNQKAEERATIGFNPPRISYIEAVLLVAERQGIEPDLAAAYISPEIKQKMAIEWEDKHMIPKKARLPF